MSFNENSERLLGHRVCLSSVLTENIITTLIYIYMFTKIL